MTAAEGMFGAVPSPSRLGLTKMIYAIAKKVVNPAMISVFTVVPCSFSLKNFSIMLSPIQKFTVMVSSSFHFIIYLREKSIAFSFLL